MARAGNPIGVAILRAGIRGDGRPTLFLRERLNGAIQLYRMGKVDGQMAHYQAREMLASVKAMWDVDLGHPDPRYLGPHVQLNLQPAARRGLTAQVGGVTTAVLSALGPLGTPVRHGAAQHDGHADAADDHVEQR